MRISSTRNPVVKFVRSLERGRVRRQEGLYLAEGIRLLTDAIDAGQRPTLALYDPDLLARTEAGSSLLHRLPGWADEVYEVDTHVLEAVAQTETPAGAVAVLRLPQPGPLDGRRGERLGLILDRLADPGNAGTILRTADAAGVGYIVSLPDTVDLFAPKVVRAGMGAHFRLPIYTEISWPEVRDTLHEVTFVGTDVREGSSIYAFQWPTPAALVIGREARGIDARAAERIARWIHIPMRGGVESLNASVAASIAIYAALGPLISEDK